MKINNVYCMDVLSFLDSLDNQSIDLAIVDPPYNINIDKWDIFNSEQEYLKFTFDWINLLIKKLKPSGSFYMFNNPYNSALIVNYLRAHDVKFKNWIVWYKKDGFGPTKRKYVNNQEVILFYTISEQYTFNAEQIRTPYLSHDRIKAAATKGIIKENRRWYPNVLGKLCTDVWEFSSHRHKTKVNGKIIKSIHPTPKPEDLIQRIILASSNPNDLVLDLFSGTGTTSFVAKKNNRNFIACDNNGTYVDFILKRLELI